MAIRWVKLFALKQVTAEVYAAILIDEVILRYGTARRLASDSGVKFISWVMQKIFCWNIPRPDIAVPPQ